MAIDLIPISLLISFSKVFENVIYTWIYQHINQNNILVNEQYAVRSNSSTENASYKLINKTVLAMNNKLTFGGIFCDLQESLQLCQSQYFVIYLNGIPWNSRQI
jgi:hypothetical protein